MWKGYFNIVIIIINFIKYVSAEERTNIDLRTCVACNINIGRWNVYHLDNRQYLSRTYYWNWIIFLWYLLKCDLTSIIHLMVNIIQYLCVYLSEENTTRKNIYLSLKVKRRTKVGLYMGTFDYENNDIKCIVFFTHSVKN